MKLNDIFLKEADDTYSFVFKKWDGNDDDEDVHVEPFDVLVKYHAEAGGHSDHPYGEGTAREHHGDTIAVLSLTADEPVKVTAEKGHRLETIKNHDKLHALVVGKLGTGTLRKVQAQFPDAILMRGNARIKGTAGVLEIISFFEDHQDDDIIIDVDNSPMLSDIHCVNTIKGLLDGKATITSAVHQKEVPFNGRLIIVASDLHEVNDGIELRCVTVDLTKDTTYPRGTPVQQIPGWRESSMKFFEDKAHENFTGGN